MAVLKYYNTATSAWEYIAASTTANFTTWKKTMAGGETSVSGTDDNSVTLSYTVGLEQVFINGVLQVRGTDYVATTGTSVTGLSTLAVNDVVTVVCYAPFNVANTIAPTVVDAKGDLIVATAADTVGRLAVGTDGQLLAAASGETSGLKWVNPGLTLIKTETFSASAAASVDNVFSATYNSYRIILNLTSVNTDIDINMRLRVSNADESGAVYRRQSIGGNGTSLTGFRQLNTTSWESIAFADSATANTNTSNNIEIFNPFQSRSTNAFTTRAYAPTGNIELINWCGGINNTTSYTGFTIIVGTGSVSGTISVLGYNK